MSADFTKRFQKALSQQIRELLEEWDIDEELEVGCEGKPTGLGWNGLADIWICQRQSPTGARRPRIINVEIEHWSCPGQAFRNVEHVKTWVKGEQARRASVLHLVHSEANLSDGKCTDLFSYGVDSRDKRFTYDFRVYDVSDHRASAALAREMVDRYDFRSLLWQHLRFTRLVDG